MALVKPLVLVNGQIQQIQAGDVLNTVTTEVDIITLANATGASAAIGKAVYKTGTGNQFQLALGASGTQARVIGFCREVIPDGVAGYVQTDGVLGGFVGLVTGSEYYLSPTVAGDLTTTPPTTPGQYLARIGSAISSTELEITIVPTILL